mmetsp:Transcript_11031/g.38893  ORF Transcript_11031/g.38893 Transcript_11031/m.38893 type:complete len:359 (-) Transcript_11031:174-1250(-)
MPTGPKEHADDLPRMVYVGNLAWSVKWQDLKDHMKQAGTVEFCRILTFDGSDWGRSRGMAYVRYETEAEAQAAVAALNTSELAGRAITVDPWTGAKPRTGPPKGSGKGYFFVKGGGKEGHKGGFQMGAKGWGKGWGKNVQVHGDNSQMVYVANLPFKAEWQEVKDHFKSVGTVEFVKILTQDGTEYGQSKAHLEATRRRQSGRPSARHRRFEAAALQGERGGAVAGGAACGLAERVRRSLAGCLGSGRRHAAVEGRPARKAEALSASACRSLPPWGRSESSAAPAPAATRAGRLSGAVHRGIGCPRLCRCSEECARICWGLGKEAVVGKHRQRSLGCCPGHRGRGFAGHRLRALHDGR